MRIGIFFMMIGLISSFFAEATEETITTRKRLIEVNGEVKVVFDNAKINPKTSAVIICDMWDGHWCKGAARRVDEMAKPMNKFIKKLRGKGYTIIHSPSSVVNYYNDHPGRKRTQELREFKAPNELTKEVRWGTNWCWPDKELETEMPIDDSDMGCDCEIKCSLPNNGQDPWTKQNDLIEILDSDYISDNGQEVYNIFKNKKIENVFIMGVHLNMCVLGRPFGIRQLVKNMEMNTFLIRDLTDSMYNSKKFPYVNHFTGTDLVVNHIEKYWCPTVLSISLDNSVSLFKFKEDNRNGNKILKFNGKNGPGKGRRIVLITGDEEYRSEQSLPMLAEILSKTHGFDCDVIFSWDETYNYIDPTNQKGLIGLEQLYGADMMIIGTRKRILSPLQSQIITDYLNTGKPIIGLRTATHGFHGEGAFGGKIKHVDFGKMILGEGWVSHHGKHKVEGCRAVIENENLSHPILKGVKDIFCYSDVYGVKNLTDKNTILIRGGVTNSLDPNSNLLKTDKNNPMMPLAWLHTYTAPNGTKGTSFCFTGGSSIDFEFEDLRRLIVNAVYYLNNIETKIKANVDYLRPYNPSFYGFMKSWEWEKYKFTLDSYLGEKGLVLPDPRKTPKYRF